MGQNGTGMNGMMKKAAVLAVLVSVLALPAPAEAQLKPYLAVFGGQTRSTWIQGGLNQQTLDWRNTGAVEVGFQLLGLTVSPGYMWFDGASWEYDNGSSVRDYHVGYKAYYLNVGAREDFGVYFSGGLNWSVWDEVPQFVIGTNDLRADSEIGFQAFLGFIVSLEVVPIKLLLEAGYMQINGHAKPIPAGEVPDLYDVTTNGPMVRIGIAIGK